MIEGIIFDMDGVIIQSEMMYQKRRALFFEEEGIPVDAEFNQGVIGSNPVDMFEMLFPESVEKQSLFLAKYRLFKQDFPMDYGSIMTEGVEDTLRELQTKGYRIGLASSGEYQTLIKILNETELSDYFEVVVSGADMPKSKPAPDVYLEAVKQMGLQATECLAVEDSTHGIQAAISAGLTCLALKPEEYEVDQTLATDIIFSLKDIPRWLST